MTTSPLLVMAVWMGGTLASLVLVAWISDLRGPMNWDMTCARCGRYRKGHYLWTLSLSHQVHLHTAHLRQL